MSQEHKKNGSTSPMQIYTLNQGEPRGKSSPPLQESARGKIQGALQDIRALAEIKKKENEMTL